MMRPRESGYRLTRIDDLPRLPQSEGADWRPVRRTLGLTGFSANAYTVASAGDEVIEPHDELSPNSGHHEELYLVVSGRATFTVQDEEIDAPVGTMLAVDVGTRREAIAAEPETTVLVIGGEPGTALPPSAFEYWYAAEPHYLAGEYERGIELLTEGLEHHADSPGLNYQLACYHALAGHGDEAVRHLRAALEHDQRVAGWAAEDTDLDSLRERSDFPALN
jgi:mannose-6-phosphate isomerase-like protein (cupin superfamily)